MYRTHLRRLILVLIILALSSALAGCGGSKDPTPEPPAPVGDAAAGEKVYQTTCIACHGPDAKGVKGLGKSLHPVDSEFVRSKTDAELVEYIKVGRRTTDPLNTTGVDMPPKGGNPAMTEEEMFDVTAFMRTLK
jgi:mono/diheme cytochrome c family protein